MVIMDKRSHSGEVTVAIMRSPGATNISAEIAALFVDVAGRTPETTVCGLGRVQRSRNNGSDIVQDGLDGRPKRQTMRFLLTTSCIRIIGRAKRWG